MRSCTISSRDSPPLLMVLLKRATPPLRKWISTVPSIGPREKKIFFLLLKKTFLYFFCTFLYFFCTFLYFFCTFFVLFLYFFCTFFVLFCTFLTGSGSSQSQKSKFLQNGLMNIVHTFSIIAESCPLPFFKFWGKSIVQISRKWGIPQKIPVHMQYLGNGWRYDDETW